MKTIVAGCRTVTDYSIVERAIRECEWGITEIVSGGARGVDALGELYAKKNGVPVKIFPADWGRHGKSAGPIRNEKMAKYADALIAVWDFQSKGTKDMIDRARKHKMKIIIVSSWK